MNEPCEAQATATESSASPRAVIVDKNRQYINQSS